MTNQETSQVMAILPFRTSTYARGIYLFGSQRLTARDGYTGVASGYAIPVMNYAGVTYSVAQIDEALAKGWISKEEYDITMSYKI